MSVSVSVSVNVRTAWFSYWVGGVIVAPLALELLSASMTATTNCSSFKPAMISFACSVAYANKQKDITWDTIKALDSKPLQWEQCHPLYSTHTLSLDLYL